ncbi:MAG: 2-amino-4-hydroxy-6-hydroxymethyldihydropteridine diphosphokinase [Bacteroidaceae bacterium]|nr:2-amino-4-hydroxy-6-hydroxymethyldihydropteridine diphosphokinase [Bacteroidaceae bacterium]
MHKLYISLGSNLGNKEEKLHRAIELINERIGSVLRTSSFIETEPWGFQSENTFQNAVCLVETELTPMQCLRETQKIERLLGRTQKSTDGKYHDRPIDLDLLLYDDLQVNEEDLILPHPHMQERDFVMIPLREIMEDSECYE